MKTRNYILNMPSLSVPSNASYRTSANEQLRKAKEQRAQGDYNEASLYYMDCISNLDQLTEKQDPTDLSLKAESYQALSDLERAQGNTRFAEEFARKATKILNDIQQTELNTQLRKKANEEFSTAEACQKNGDVESAEYYYTECVYTINDISEPDSEDQFLRAKCYQAVGEIAKTSDNSEYADKCASKAKTGLNKAEVKKLSEDVIALEKKLAEAPYIEQSALETEFSQKYKLHDFIIKQQILTSIKQKGSQVIKKLQLTTNSPEETIKLKSDFKQLRYKISRLTAYLQRMASDEIKSHPLTLALGFFAEQATSTDNQDKLGLALVTVKTIKGI